MRLFLLIIGLLLMSLSANAQEKLKIRVCAKIILNPVDGSWPTATFESSIDNGIAFMNERMNHYRRPIEFIKEPTVTIGGVNTAISNTYYPGDTSNNNSNGPRFRQDLQDDARNNPIAYGWREDCINYYLNDGIAGGCSFPDNGSQIILIGSTNSNVDITYLHEIGHFFSLYHTHQGAASQCGGAPGNDDEIAETLPDRPNTSPDGNGDNQPCWNHIDSVAQHSYNQDYDQLSGVPAWLVENTFFNIMSYHSTVRSELTDTQLDRWMKTIVDFNTRQAVVSGTPYFVDDDDNTPCNLSGASPCGCEGNAYVPFEKVDCALDLVDPNGGDVIVIKSGTFDVGPDVISQPVLITASRNGDAILK